MFSKARMIFRAKLPIAIFNVNFVMKHKNVEFERTALINK